MKVLEHKLASNDLYCKDRAIMSKLFMYSLFHSNSPEAWQMALYKSDYYRGIGIVVA